MSHCDDSLRKIAQAICIYQENHDHKNPDQLESLVEIDLISPWDLVCPAGGYGIGQCAYVYRGAGLDRSALKEMILAYDKKPVHKGRRNILFADGHLERPPEKVFQSWVKKDNVLRGELGLPELDPEG